MNGPYIAIKIPKCLLLATREEFKRMVRRGKYFKRAQKTAEREGKTASFDIMGEILE